MSSCTVVPTDRAGARLGDCGGLRAGTPLLGPSRGRYPRHVGLTYTCVRQLLVARASGASFASVLTIGRQKLTLHPREVKALEAEFGLNAADLVSAEGFADCFFRDALGAVRLDTMDASAYEGASIVHDLNVPIGDELCERFDAVIDGGSLEHIFDIPTALASLMRMVKLGGRMLLVNPANNLCGHGFYQFSPELAFRAFGPEQGFELERVALVEYRFPIVELSGASAVLDVTDPSQMGRRVQRQSWRPAMLMIQARKTRHLPEPFAVAPQQSDYAKLWQAKSTAGRKSGRLHWLPPRARGWLVGVREIIWSSRLNRDAYTPSR
jgi:hypothetical protein